MQKIFILLLLVSGQMLCAQNATPRQFTQNDNIWFSYLGAHKFAPKWGLHLEAQLRRADWGHDAQQLLLRGGLNYHLNASTVATAGYCFVETYPYGAFAAKTSFPEHRFWEQIQLRQNNARFELVHRFRLEQRNVHNPVASGTEFKPGPAVYSNRFRLMHRASVPFHGRTIAEKSWYFTAFDELFVAFGKNVGHNIFDQNRAFAGVGYRFSKVGRLELGYLNQLVFKSDGIRVENNHTLLLAFSSALDLRL